MPENNEQPGPSKGATTKKKPKKKDVKRITYATKKSTKSPIDFRYKLDVSNSQLQQHRSSTALVQARQPMRPVEMSRYISRHPAATIAVRPPSDQRNPGLGQDRRLTAYVRSMSVIMQRPSKVQSRKYLMRDSMWDTDTSSRYKRDLEVIFSQEDLKKKTRVRPSYYEPRSAWLTKIEESGRANVYKARKFWNEDDTGDVCCCPVFTAHILCPVNYIVRIFYKGPPKKRAARKRTKSRIRFLTLKKSSQTSGETSGETSNEDAKVKKRN